MLLLFLGAEGKFERETNFNHPLREAIPRKHLLIFGFCQNGLDPLPSFLGHLRGTFFKMKKVPEKKVHIVLI